jgi:hypothetical protein
MTWSSRLTRVIVTRNGQELFTLAQARAYILALGSGVNQRQHWQQAAALLLEARKTGSKVMAATDQMVLALFIEGRLDIGKTPVEVRPRFANNE